MLFLLLVVGLIGTACLKKGSVPTSLFSVRPAASLPPIPGTAPNVNVGSLTFRAIPLLTDEETQELFESNLQLAGLQPIRVEIVHNSGDAVDLRRLRFHLRDSVSADWKLISAKAAVARILKANNISTYNPHFRAGFEKEVREYELDLKSPLTQAEPKRQGMLFFLSPKKEPVSSPHGLTMTIEGLPQPAMLQLN